MTSETESKKVVRSKKILTEAFFELLHEHPGEKFTIKDICKKANYTRATFYAHFDKIEDIPYHYYKKNGLDENVENYMAHIARSKEQQIPLTYSLEYMIKTNFSYWATQVKTYKLLKSIEMEGVLARLFEENTRIMYAVLYPKQHAMLDAISKKCIIKGHSQLAHIIYDIWAYSGRKMDADEIASIILKIIDGNSELSEVE